MQKTGKVEPTVSPEKVSAVQEISVGSSTHARATCSSTEQHTSMHSITGALDILDRLRDVVFCRPEGTHNIAAIAEDVAEVVRRAIAHGEGGENAKAVDHGRLVAVLIEAVNEQQLQIKDQERSLKEQKSQIARLRADIERLKTAIRARMG
jgi:hypothetical protein